MKMFMICFEFSVYFWLFIYQSKVRPSFHVFVTSPNSIFKCVRRTVTDLIAKLQVCVLRQDYCQ